MLNPLRLMPAKRDLPIVSPLYLYRAPFLVEKTTASEFDHVLDYYSDTDRADVEKIHATLFKFAVEEKLVEVVDSNALPSTIQQTGSWLWAINRMNFRSLIVAQQYANLMSSLQVDNNHPLNQILDLHSRLGILFDEKLLNTIVHRVMTSIQIIPYPLKDNEQIYEWNRIHQETPFIWMIILLQTVIRSTTKKL